MKVLAVILSRYPPDHNGAALIFHRIAINLVSLGKANVCILRFSSKDHASYIIDNIRVNTIRYLIPCKGFLLPLGVIEIIIRSIIYLKKNSNIDVFHGISVNWTTLSFLYIAKLFSKKTIIESTITGDVIPPVGKNLKILYWLKEYFKIKIIKKFDKCKVYSRALREELNSIGVYSVREIPPPVDPEIFYPATRINKIELRQNLGIPKGSFVFFFCGVVGLRKGFDLVIHAFLKLQGVMPNAFLYAAGPLETDYLIPKEALNNTAIRFTREKVDNVPDLFRMADCFVLPSRIEGFGSVFIEAMSSKIPVITSHLPGITDDIFGARRGIVVPHSADELFNEMCKLVSNDVNQMLDQAYSYALSKYSLSRVSDETFKMWSEL